MNPVDFTKLFSIIDSIVCCLIECRDEANTIHFLTAGYWGGQILIKLELEEDVSIFRFELDSEREAKQKMEWIIQEKKLNINVVTYFFDAPKANISSDFYSDNQIQYTFDGRSRSGEPIKMSYRLSTPDINYQDLCENYTHFLELLSQNDRKLSIVEVSQNPNKILRKNKILSLLDD